MGGLEYGCENDSNYGCCGFYGIRLSLSFWLIKSPARSNVERVHRYAVMLLEVHFFYGKVSVMR